MCRLTLALSKFLREPGTTLSILSIIQGKTNQTALRNSSASTSLGGPRNHHSVELGQKVVWEEVWEEVWAEVLALTSVSEWA